MDDATPLVLGKGIGAIHRGRPAGRRGRGVGIFFKKSKMKVLYITPKSSSEIVAALCSVRNC